MLLCVATLLNSSFYFILIIQIGMGFLVIAETWVSLDQLEGCLAGLFLLPDEIGRLGIGR